MAIEETVYEVPGWGAGTLWTEGRLVLAHEFDYVGAAAVEGQRPAPPSGGRRPPRATLPEEFSRMGHRSVPVVRRPFRDTGQSLPNAWRPISGSPAQQRRVKAAPDVVARLAAFFEGEHRLDDVPLDLSWCTPFQRDALEALRRIPPGELVTYGELAALAGRPGAQRAVGTLCARNRFALLVPCHRVVAADGIGGYGSAGVSVKRRLLALEGVRL